MADDPNDSKPIPLDDLDEKIVAVYGTNPGCSLSFVAERVQCGKTTVWDRLQRIPDKDWAGDVAKKFPNLKVLIYDAIERALLSDDVRVASAVALEVADRLGFLPKKHRHEHSGPDGEPIAVNGRVFVFKLPDNGSAPKATGDAKPE